MVLDAAPGRAYTGDMASNLGAILNKHCRPESPSTLAIPAGTMTPRAGQSRPPQERSPAPQMAFAAPIILPQGDGSVKVMPGKPVQWLTAKQVASIFGSSESSVYRWIDSGDIPPECVDIIGARKKRIRADAVERARQTWRARREAA